MKTAPAKAKLQRKNIIYTAIATVAILMIPLVFTLLGSGVDGDGWHWTLSDFIIMGILIFGAGLLLNLAMIKVRSTKYRLIFCGAIVLVFMLIWAELAVGVFGTPFAGS